MRTKEEILAELKEAEQEVEKATDREQKAQQELTEMTHLNLADRFPHLTKEEGGRVSGTLEHPHVLANVSEHAPTIKLSYVIDALPLDRLAMVRLSMSAGSRAVDMLITDTDLHFLDQLVKDAHAAVRNEKIEIRKPFFTTKEENRYE
ncbi:hypothetical protein [Bacillus phage SDFMU_Pbc]|uniref:Uncharacterized protein n=1 Tax=Bacillus phage SDFMU_Pbc TaxID=3076135 RepID=A0AA96QYE4_9CAUD|nr:hypothetical protein [Bacillus phage SDFMU_Pbc]